MRCSTRCIRREPQTHCHKSRLDILGMVNCNWTLTLEQLVHSWNTNNYCPVQWHKRNSTGIDHGKDHWTERCFALDLVSNEFSQCSIAICLLGEAPPPVFCVEQYAMLRAALDWTCMQTTSRQRSDVHCCRSGEIAISVFEAIDL